MAKQQHLSLFILGLIPSSGAAFSTTRDLPANGLLRPTAGIRRATRVVLSIDSSSTRDQPKFTSHTPKIGIVQTTDFGEELVLANIENATPESIFGSHILADSEAGANDLGNEVSLSSSDVFGLTLNANTTSTSATELGAEINQQVVTTRNVEAVLAASEEAMFAAEASLPTEVKEELKLFANVPMATNKPDVSVSTNVKDLVTKAPADTVPFIKSPLNIEAPTVMTILKFAIPAIGVWLCSPMLSLIDTSAVGILSGTTQQAALNPAVAITDYAALLMAFLYTGTTNIVASAQESDRTRPGKPTTTSAMIGAMQLSTYVGLGLGVALFSFARPLLRAIIGNDAINPAVFAAAMKYVRIRALGMPAAAIIGSAQAGCLGCKDIKSPLYVLLAAAVVNFLGDVMFVGSKNPWIGGAAGAAWATVFSQYAALAIFVQWLVKMPKTRDASPKVLDLTKNIKDFMEGDKGRNNLKQALESSQVQLHKHESPFKVKALGGKVKGIFGRVPRAGAAPMAAKPMEEDTSVRGLLAGRVSGLDLVKLPSKEIVKEFTPYFAPVTATTIGRVSGYVAMSHVISSSLGTISMAAQQVIVSVFYCLCPVADSLSLTAQSFIPGISDRKPSKERADALRKTGRNFLMAGGIFGAVMAFAIGLLPILSGFFTGDPAVVSLVNTVVPLLVGFFLVHGFAMASEGLLLGQKDLGFLGKMYASFFFAVPFFMLRVKQAVLAGVQGITIGTIWSIFLGYQIFRVIVWVFRVQMIQKATDHAVSAFQDVRSPISPHFTTT